MNASTTIRGYLVDVEDETTETTQCWVEKDGHSASLACLQDTGVLTNYRGEEIAVNEGTIDKITEWAEENGY